MKKAVMYGAGNIGRGFIGQVFSLSGYEVAFVDVNMAVIDALNAEKSYPLRIVTNEGETNTKVENVYGVNGNDIEAVSKTIAEADIMATAVGVNILKFIAPVLAQAFTYRWESGNMTPLDVIVCENKIEANEYLKGLIAEKLDEKGKALLEEKIGFVEASIGRMVPVMTAEQKAEHPLLVLVEPYCELPVDKSAFKNTIPDLVNLQPFSPFEFFIKRKLYIHNMGHATSAYLGALKGCSYIYEAMGYDNIKDCVKAAMLESAAMLSKDYDVPYAELEAFVCDLIERFGNKALGDTIVRVGGDPKRKLSDADRFFGAVKDCVKAGLPFDHIICGIAAAMYFCPETDATAPEIQAEIAEKGVRSFVLARVAELDEAQQTKVCDAIVAAYNAIGAAK